MRGLHRLSVLTVLVALVAGACDDDDDDAAGDEATAAETGAETAADTDGEFSSMLGGTAWILDPASIDVVIPEGGEEVTMDFSTDGSFAGHAGCNTYTGTYTTTDGGEITVSDPAITRMMCEDNVMAVETAYLSALAQVSQFAVSGDVLTFSDGEGEVLRYNRG